MLVCCWPPPLCMSVCHSVVVDHRLQTCWCVIAWVFITSIKCVSVPSPGCCSLCLHGWSYLAKSEKPVNLSPPQTSFEPNQKCPWWLVRIRCLLFQPPEGICDGSNGPSLWLLGAGCCPCLRGWLGIHSRVATRGWLGGNPVFQTVVCKWLSSTVKSVQSS